MTAYHKLFAGAVLVGTLTGSFALSASADPLADLQPQQRGDITYVSGGIGDGEEQAMKSEARNFNLQIINTDKSGEYTADTNLIITGKQGHEMLRVDQTGPLFYAKLPPGNYMIDATNGDEHRVRRVTIPGMQSKDVVRLTWQQS